MPPAGCGVPSASVTVTGDSIGEATSCCACAKAADTKTPVHPQSTRITAGRDSTKPASLMSALLEVVTWFASGEVEPACPESPCRDGSATARGWALAFEAFWVAEDGSRWGAPGGAFGAKSWLLGPGSWPESGESECPSALKRFEVGIFCAGPTEKKALGSRASCGPSPCSGSSDSRRAVDLHPPPLVQALVRCLDRRHPRHRYGHRPPLQTP